MEEEEEVGKTVLSGSPSVRRFSAASSSASSDERSLGRMLVKPESFPPRSMTKVSCDVGVHSGSGGHRIQPTSWEERDAVGYGILASLVQHLGQGSELVHENTGASVHALTSVSITLGTLALLSRDQTGPA